MKDVPALTLGDVQVLLDRPKGAGMIVSCYVDTSEAGYRSAWAQRFRNEVARVEQQLAGDHRARQRFAREVDVIGRALGKPAARRARGMVVFSGAAENFFQAFALGVPIKDRLVLDEQPYLAPLLQALHRQRRYLVVLTDSHRGRLFAAGWGHAQLVDEMSEAVPRHQRSAGETWGKQQATIARHREDRILHYRKELARRVERAWGDAPFRGLILLGEHETVRAVRAALPAPLATQVIHEQPHAWVGRQPSIDTKVRGVLDEALSAHDQRLADEVERRLREAYCVAAGPQEVVDALWNGQVGYPGYIVLEPDQGRAATRCTGCGSVHADMPIACPLCGAACEKVNLWQEVLLFAARHNIPAHSVEGGAELARHGGIAAMLSREGPWEPVAAGVRLEKTGGSP